MILSFVRENSSPCVNVEVIDIQYYNSQILLSSMNSVKV